jgi:hypothetical protein
MNARVRIGSMGPWPVQSLGGARPRAAMLRQEREDVGENTAEGGHATPRTGRCWGGRHWLCQWESGFSYVSRKAGEGQRDLRS